MARTTAAYVTTSIMGNDRGPACPACGRKIQQQQRLATIEGVKYHSPACVPDFRVEGVKAHALAHYEDGGWDVIVECWDDAQIAEQIAGTRTVAGAVRRFSDVVAVWADRQADARNSAF